MLDVWQVQNMQTPGHSNWIPRHKLLLGWSRNCTNWRRSRFSNIKHCTLSSNGAHPFLSWKNFTKILGPGDMNVWPTSPKVTKGYLNNHEATNEYQRIPTHWRYWVYCIDKRNQVYFVWTSKPRKKRRSSKVREVAHLRFDEDMEHLKGDLKDDKMRLQMRLDVRARQRWNWRRRFFSSYTLQYTVSQLFGRV